MGYQENGTGKNNWYWGIGIFIIVIIVLILIAIFACWSNGTTNGNGNQPTPQPTPEEIRADQIRSNWRTLNGQLFNLADCKNSAEKRVGITRTLNSLGKRICADPAPFVSIMERKVTTVYSSNCHAPKYPTSGSPHSMTDPSQSEHQQELEDLNQELATIINRCVNAPMDNIKNYLSLYDRYLILMFQYKADGLDSSATTARNQLNEVTTDISKLFYSYFK